MDDIAPSNLTVVALRAALKKRGESTTGSKAALVKRLKCAIDADASAMTTGEAKENATTASHDGVALIEAVHRGDVDAVRALVAAGALVGRSWEQDDDDSDGDDDDGDGDDHNDALWVIVYGSGEPRRMRHHHDVDAAALQRCVDEGDEKGLLVTQVSCARNRWTLVMESDTGFGNQCWELSKEFLPKEWILERWDEDYFVTALAGANDGSCLVIMSKTTSYERQSYKLSDHFPLSWVEKKTKDGFRVTAIATSNER